VVVLDDGVVSFVGRPQEWAAQPGLGPSSALLTVGDSDAAPPSFLDRASSHSAPVIADENSEALNFAQVEHSGRRATSGMSMPMGHLGRARSEPIKALTASRLVLEEPDTLHRTKQIIRSSSSTGPSSLTGHGRTAVESTAKGEAPFLLADSVCKSAQSASLEAGLDSDILSARRASQDETSTTGRSDSEAVPLLEQEAREVGSVRWAIYRWVADDCITRQSETPIILPSLRYVERGLSIKVLINLKALFAK
jgi:hypothetical protein